MKIVDRKTFLAMPPNTLFSKYEPCIFGELMIKGDSLASDFYYSDIAGAVMCNDSSEFSEVLVSAAETGGSFAMDFVAEGRDGLFDYDQLFSVWEQKDIMELIDRLLGLAIAPAQAEQ